MFRHANKNSLLFFALGIILFYMETLPAAPIGATMPRDLLAATMAKLGFAVVTYDGSGNAYRFATNDGLAMVMLQPNQNWLGYTLAADNIYSRATDYCAWPETAAALIKNGQTIGAN